METISAVRERLFALIKEKAYHPGPIKLASGKTSDYYIDARAVTLSSEGAYCVGRLLLDLVRGDAVQAVGGPTLGADPLVGALAAVSFQEKHPVNTFLIRKTPKAHGRMLQVEGPPLEAGARVVLIDDVATTGGSLIDAIAVLGKMDVKVDRAIVVVDREEGAAANLAAKGCALSALFKASDFSARR
ncbi:MAG: orotate phosphoribosyltransferase [Deltaproteobacteria bacterium]